MYLSWGCCKRSVLFLSERVAGVVFVWIVTQWQHHELVCLSAALPVLELLQAHVVPELELKAPTTAAEAAA